MKGTNKPHTLTLDNFCYQNFIHYVQYYLEIQRHWIILFYIHLRRASRDATGGACYCAHCTVHKNGEALASSG